MTLIEKTLIAASTLLFLAAAPIVHAAQPVTSSDDPAAYIAGTKAMNDRRWKEAISSFDQVINARQQKADAALYWKAYSLQKLGNSNAATATCDQLHQQYTSSTWNKDCDALNVDINGVHVAGFGPLPPVPPLAPVPPIGKAYTIYAGDRMRIDRDADRDPNAEIKMLALNSLLNQDPARAIPLLRGILASNDQTPNMKRHAIFVLAQSKSPEAQAILNDAVLGKLDPSLQREAIQSMGIYKGKAANDTLAEVYNKTTDIKVKQAVINAFFISQDAPRMVELAKNEKNLELKRNIVSQLAIMHDKAATDYMIELLK